MTPTGPNHIVVRFDDTEDLREDLTEMKNNVIKVLDWVGERTLALTSNILVHCHAGISRSSAMAWLILVKLGMEPKEAFQSLYKNRPIIWPNTCVLRLGAEYLSLGKEFLDLVILVDNEIAEIRSTQYLGYGG
jgi:predicted protein tyrosine phosphatase